MKTTERPCLQTVCTAVLVLVLATHGTAAETDQFYARDQQLADSTAVLNTKINQKLSKIAAEYAAEPRSYVVAYAVYRKFGGLRFTDKYESWLLESPAVAKRRVSRDGSIYRNMPIWSIRAVYIFDLGPTVKINDTLVGSDKISHFFSQGWKFYKRYQRSHSEEQAARRSVLTERAIFGANMTGSFSNADLVANYEGHRFYRSLFEDDVIPGKAAILKREHGVWIVQRPFDWADHVNAYWDEALNMNDFDIMLRKRMTKRLVKLCPRYWRNPALYAIADEIDLANRYAHLGMRDTRANRLDRVCLGHRPATRVLMATNLPELGRRNQFGL